MYNFVELINNSVDMLNNRLVSLQIITSKKATDATIIFQQCYNYLSGNIWHIEETIDKNNVIINIDNIKSIKHEITLDCLEFLIETTEDSIIRIHTY